jgi:DNA-binding GntR family transcriptional regulator
LLEGEAARKATINITDSSLEEMKRLHKEMLAVDLNGELSPFSLLNYRFHAVLYASSGNSILVRQIEQVGAIYPRTRAIFAMIPERIISANREHAEILIQLERRDSEGTKRILLEHMAHGYNLLLNYREALKDKAG